MWLSVVIYCVYVEKARVILKSVKRFCTCARVSGKRESKAMLVGKITKKKPLKRVLCFTHTLPKTDTQT